MANGDSLLLLGLPGVGKTHLAVSLGREAIPRGYSTLFVPAMGLVTTPARAHSEGRLEDKLLQYSKTKLLIIDELGYLPFEPNAAHLFFQLVSRRYERGSTMVTSNRSVGEWGNVFSDAVVATAILDRMLHCRGNHCPKYELGRQIGHAGKAPTSETNVAGSYQHVTMPSNSVSTDLTGEMSE